MCACVHKDDNFQSGSVQPSTSDSTLLRAPLDEEDMKELPARTVSQGCGEETSGPGSAC